MKRRLSMPWVQPAPTTDAERLLRAIFPGPVLKPFHRALAWGYGRVKDPDGLLCRFLCPFQDALVRLERLPRPRFTRTRSTK